MLAAAACGTGAAITTLDAEWRIGLGAAAAICVVFAALLVRKDLPFK